MKIKITDFGLRGAINPGRLTKRTGFCFESNLRLTLAPKTGMKGRFEDFHFPGGLVDE